MNETSDWVGLLDGLVFSDGCIRIPPGCRRPRYVQTSKSREFLEWVASWLPTSSKVSGPQRQGAYTHYQLTTPVSEIYTSAFERWYGTGKKAIPSDFAVTRSTMLGAYLGDGSINRGRVSLSTYAFERGALLRLVIDPLSRLGIEGRLTPRNVVEIRRAPSVLFLELIGEPPVEALAYKWAAPPESYRTRIAVAALRAAHTQLIERGIV